MNEPTEKQMNAFVRLLAKLDLTWDELEGIITFINSQEILLETVDRLEARDFKLTSRETVNNCGYHKKRTAETPSMIFAIIFWVAVAIQLLIRYIKSPNRFKLLLYLFRSAKQHQKKLRNCSFFLLIFLAAVISAGRSEIHHLLR